MAPRLIQFALNFPTRVYLLVWLLVISAAAMIPAMVIDTDPENMLPQDDPARQFHQATKAQFNLYDSIVVGAVAEQGFANIDSLQQMKWLTDAIMQLPGVISSEVMALSTMDNISQQQPGVIRFDYLMAKAPQQPAQAQQIAAAVQRLPLLHNTVLSADGQAAAIYVPLTDKSLSYPVAEQIRALIAQLPQQFSANGDRYHLTGLPVAENQFGHEMFVQMAVAAPLAGLTIFALMWWFFRSVPLVMAPMLVAMATVVITSGTLIGMGFTVHIMSSMIAIFLMPIAVVDSVHIMSDFTLRYRQGADLRHTIEQVMADLFQPMLFTSLTSALGFYSLLLTPIPPVQVFGAFVGSGILLAFALSMLLLPAYLIRLSPHALTTMRQRLQRRPQHNWSLLGQFSQRQAKPLLALALLLLGVSAVGISKIEINDNPLRWFKSDHSLRVADRTLNHHFAGTYNAYLVVQSTPTAQLDPALLPPLQRLLPQHNSDIALAAKGDPQALQQLLLLLDDLHFNRSDAAITKQIETLLPALEQLQQQQQRLLQPQLLGYLAQLQQHLLETGLVGKSNGLPDLVKTVYRELSSGDDRDYRLPDSAAAVAQTLLQYQSSHRPKDLWHFVSPDYRSGLLWLQLTSGDNQHMTAVMQQLDNFVAANPLPAGISLRWAGKAYINVVWQQAMVAGMANSLMSAFVVILLMMTLLFRSPLYGVLAMLPLTLTIAIIYGLVGWLGKDYDMPIAVLSALALGLSVDFAIHFLERARALHRRCGHWQGTLTALFQEPATAISRNAIVIALGFTPLLLSPLVPYVTVGVLMAAIMLISALVTLLLLPAALGLLQRRAFPQGDHHDAS
ncbi:MMPL family transporter [uncultured Ferrimonas sp.]|uniref:efflux RND transporter permease subunit n=1 Tax=uncultured Ferrimonas sp. TaxID=432640 RepID=UPI002613182B|nr:MMPL family transporter [uncultured Ferrimonas sp.]